MVVGNTDSTNFPTTGGAFDTTYNGIEDVFITKLNSTASALVFSTYLGGANGDESRAMRMDAGNNIYIAGRTDSTDFPLASAFQATNNGSSDAFMLKMNGAANGLVYSTYIGGTGLDRALGLEIDSSGAAYIAGETNSSNFPITGNALYSYKGNGDVFVSKIVDNSSTPTPTRTNTAGPSATRTLTRTATRTNTAGPSSTATSTNTAGPSNTPGAPTNTRTVTSTRTITRTPTITPTTGPQTNSSVYIDNLVNGWRDDSWDASVNLQDNAFVRTGSFSLSCTYTGAYGGLFLKHSGFNTTGYQTLEFYINGGTASGQQMTFALHANNSLLNEVNLNNYIEGGGVAANTWRKVSIPLSAVSGTNRVITGILIQDDTGGAQPTYYIDDMQFVGTATSTSTPSSNTATSTRTNTPLPGNTSTSTPLPPTNTNTAVSTSTNTPGGATSTRTNTPAAATSTFTPTANVTSTPTPNTCGAVIMNGQTTVSDPTFNRPNSFGQGSPCSPSATGAGAHYQYYEFQISTSGSVLASTCSTDGGSANFDTDLVIYQAPGGARINPFTADPCVNALAADNNSCGIQSRLTATLVAGYFYVVVTGATSSDVGSYSLYVLMPQVCNTATPTPTGVINTPTNTSTNTPIGATSTRTNTPLNTATNTRTNTPTGATSTRTNTPINTSTNTRTNTPSAATSTSTNTPVNTSTPTPNTCGAVIMNGQTTVSDPTFNRPNSFDQGSPCSPSATGAGAHYQYYEFQISTSGSVLASTCATDGGSANFDTDLVIYQAPGGARINPFTADPCINALAADNNSCGIQSRVTATLVAGYFYVVVAGASSSDVGSYGLYVLMPQVCNTATPTPTGGINTPTNTPTLLANTATVTRTNTAGPSNTPGAPTNTRTVTSTRTITRTPTITPTTGPQTSSSVYTDNLVNSWHDDSWDSLVNLQDNAFVRTGSFALSCAYTGAYGGLFITHSGFNTTGYQTLEFYINGGTASGQQMTFALHANNSLLNEVNLNTYIAGGGVAANSWRKVSIPLSAVSGSNRVITGILIQDDTGGAQPTYFIDDMQFVAP